jgi:hypothetical protein
MNKENFSVINYTDQEIPVFREKQGQKVVTYGADDLYGDYLRDLFISSSTNGAIINGVADMIYGGGLDATDKDESDGKREQWLRLQDLMRTSDDDLLQKVAFDIKLYGMTYVNVIWNSSRTRIACIKHLPVHTMRSGVADSEGVISEYFYKSDWRDKREVEKAIKAFSNEDRTAASTCLQIKRYTPSLHYYALPDYAGGTNYIELDQEISEFHLNNIRRGFFPSMLLSFKNGVPTEQERRTIEQKVIEKFTGADNAGRILITFNDGDETAPEFTPIGQNGADGMYEYLSKLVSEKIITSHRVVSPLIFGVRSEGSGFGNNADELRDSYSLFNNTVIAPFQNILLNAFGMLFGINDIELDIFFITAKPADFLDLEVIDTLDEGVRQKEGIESEDEDVVAAPADAPTEEEEEEPDMPIQSADKEASYNGAQISSALDIIIKVGEGLLTPEQAIVFLIQMLQFDPSVAEALFTEGKDAVVEVEAARFSKLSKKKQLKVADALIELGQDEADILKDYALIDSRKVDYDQEDKFDAMWTFAKTPSSKPQAKSEQDTELIKVRYVYTQGNFANIGKSREFCDKMMAGGKTENGLKTGGRVFRKEDIIFAGDRAVNPGWGAYGASTYSIWEFKGGALCRHFWTRQTYLKKNNKKVTVNEAKRIIRTNSGDSLEDNDKRVAQAPRTWTDKGFVDPKLIAEYT